MTRLSSSASAYVSSLPCYSSFKQVVQAGEINHYSYDSSGQPTPDMRPINKLRNLCSRDLRGSYWYYKQRKDPYYELWNIKSAYIFEFKIYWVRWSRDRTYRDSSESEGHGQRTRYRDFDRSFFNSSLRSFRIDFISKAKEHCVYIVSIWPNLTCELRVQMLIDIHDVWPRQAHTTRTA